MKMSCGVIRDLLPLYIEGMDSEETHLLVEEHLSTCESCKKELEEMRVPSLLPINTDVLPLKKINIALKKKKMLTILLSVMVTLTVVFICSGYALAPRFIPYSDGIIQISENENGIVLATLSGTVAECDISSYYSKEHGGRVYYISAWDNVWNRSIGRKQAENIVINANGEPITSIYYSPNNGQEDILIYGESLFVNGGSMTVPRLALAYYALFAIVLVVTLGVVIVAIRKNKRTVRVLLKIAYLPMAYLVAHLFIKGFHAASYALTQELFSILLLTVPLYGLAWIMERLVRKELL